MSDGPSAGDGRRAITADGGAPAIGPYSAALAVGRLVFLSGQIPLRADGTLVDGGIREALHAARGGASELLGEHIDWALAQR